MYIENEEYLIVFESGKQAQFIPGTVEFFTLSRYQEEIGKDYKRIVLYLCSQTNVNAAEKGYDSSDSEFSAEEGEAKRERSQSFRPYCVVSILQQKVPNEYIDQDIKKPI